MYVYLKNPGDPYTVGFYDPQGKWHAESDQDTQADAAWRVHFLNGGNATRDVGLDDIPDFAKPAA